MKALKITGSVILVFIVVILLVVSFGLGGIIKKAVTTVGPKALGAPIELQSVRVSPFTGLVHLKGLVVGNPEGFHTDSAAQIGEFKVQVKLMSLLTDKIVVKEILIDGPQITYEKSLKSSNIAELQKNVETFVGPKEEEPEGEPVPEEEPKEKKPSKKVQIDKLLVQNGKVKLSFTAMKGRQMTVPLPKIEKEGIGADKDGATFGEAAKEVWGSIMEAIKQAAASGGDVLKDVGGAVTDEAGKAVNSVKEGASSLLKGVGNMFKKDD
ncbi:AsmA family protein [Verrucomicrobiota bacterium]